MADEDFVDFDQEWFFDELKGDQTEGTTLDPPLPPTPPPAASSSTNNHGSTSQSHPPIQQQVQQPSHQSNNTYQEQQMGQRDGMMPSTSTYGMQQQQHQPLQEQQQVPVSQHQQIHIQQAHQQQPQQQFETLQPYNPNQQNQNIQNHYQQNSQQMIFDMEMDYISNEASTSSAMPMECRISQDYNQPQQYQPQQQQQQQQGETQWIQMEQPSLMSQQHAPQMTSVVYTSTSQQMPRIPDPGGQHTNQPQILNNYNPQQTQHIIQTGINGQTMLASMQPVQRIIPQQQQPQQSQQQQFELNSNNYIQQQVAYIDHTGSQQFITSQPGEVGNVNFHQMQVIPQIVPIQSAPAVETPAPAPAPPPTAKPKATKAKGNARKKNQPPPQQPQPSAEGDSILSKIEKSGSVAVNFNDNPEKSAKMAQLMGMMAALAANEAQGFDVTEARSSLEKQLEELLTGANIIPQPTPAPPPPPKPTATYAPIAPNVPSSAASTPQQPKSKKARTKAEGQQNLQQKRAANSTASNANINSNINTNMQPQIIQQQQQQQPQQPQNESGCRIISQDANYLIVESNGTIMKAVNVRTENGTATYQILGPVDEQTLYQLKQSQQPPPQPLPPSTSQPQPQQKRVQSIQPSTFKSENDEAAPAAVLDVVNSLSSSNKSKPQKKTPARARNKKASEPPPPPPPPAVVEQKPVVIKEQEIPKPEPTVICVPSASKEPPKPKIVFPAIAVSAKRVKDKTDSRKRRIAEWVKKMKEVIATTDINSPFIDKEDVFNRLMPYGFHYEPEFSQKTMEKVEHELIRHQTHLFDRYKSIEGKMQQIFIRETTNQNYDLETNMLLAIDAEYEKQQLEKDKALFQHDPYQFIRQSDVVKTPSLNLDYITETRRLLNLNKPKNIKPTKGFHFEPSNFDETEFIKRKNKLIEEDEEQERAEKLAAFKKAHPPPPIQKPPPPKPVLPIPTPKLPPKPSIEPVKINLKLQENTVPVNKELPKIKKPIIFTSSSESSSSDDEYVKRSKTSKSKKTKSFRSPSPQKERKSKSPQKSKHIDLSVSSKEKANHVSADKLNNKQHQPSIKTTIRKPMPPELNAFYPSMNLSGYKIPKIGDPTPPPPTSTKPLPIKQESVQKEPPKFVEPIPIEFLKPSEPVTIKMKENVVKVKENIVQTLKIKKSSLSNSMDSISTHKEKKEKHHHHHHHSSKNNERSNSVISNHSTEKSSKNVERSESLNREITKVPSLVIKPPSQFKHPNEIKKEEKRSKEKEASSTFSKDKRQKDTVKTEEKPLKTKIDTPKPENPERVVQQSLKLKINIGSKKPAESPSTVNSIKESVPSPNNAPVEHKKKDKKDKHSKESRKEKKVKEEVLPVLEIMEDNINHIREAEEDEAAKEAKRKRKEEKKRQKAEKKQQKKLEKKQRKHQKEEKDETVKTTTPQINSAGGDHIKLKFSLKKPTKLVESSPSHPPSPPPPKLQPEIAAFETTPKLKFTISRNILPESTKNVKKEKDRNLKRASPKVESEPNSEAPPLKIPRVKIKLGGSQNNAAAASSSSTSYAAASTPIPPPPSTTETATTSIPSIAAAAVVEKKKSIVLKQTENSENSTSSLPLQQQPQQSTPVERPSMVGKPPTSAIENVSATPAKIRRIKKSKHGGSGFSDCSDVEETQVDLRLMTDRILSRCRD